MSRVLLAGMLAATFFLMREPAQGHAANTEQFVSKDRVTVSLVAEHAAIRAGRPVEAGVLFELADHWHVYWRNPGDSGEPPRVGWDLPAGFSAGPLAWPVPERIEIGPILNFGYEHEVLLPVTIATPDRLSVGEDVELVADVSWLVCRAEECIPGQARLVLVRPVVAQEPARDSRYTRAFADARENIPRERSASFEASDGAVTLRVPGLPPDIAADTPIAFFPFDNGIVKPFEGRATYAGDDELRMALAAGDLVSGEIETVEGVVVRGGDAFVVHAVASDRPGSDVVAASTAPALSLWWVLAFAFAGGLLLNLMPCVFPVLSLKVLSFVVQARHEPRRIRMHGWAFAGGVALSFWLLAVTLLLLRAGGQQLGWGFQLQSPVFLALLCALLFLLGLSLSGVFEVGSWMTTLGGGARTEGYSGSLLTGALATVVATPCTAPFMGPALGFALTQPFYVSLAVFTALAAGMSAPYVLLAHFPAALSRLPKPGAWMEVVRQLTAFPLYATVLWLLYVFSRQTSPDAAGRLMVGLLFLGVAAWGWGVSQRFGNRSWLARSPVALAALVGFFVAFSAAAGSYTQSREGSQTDAFWGHWSPERVVELRAEGRPVFVNFTADWCLSCQVNERTVFSTQGVRSLFETYGVQALKADWTSKDDRIARTLTEFRRDGVPLYVFYPADADAEPRILPQLPTESALREAFASGSRRAKDSAAKLAQTRKGS